MLIPCAHARRRAIFMVALMVATVCTLACTPALNWREVRLSGGEVKALLPCKPDEATRTQQIGNESRNLHLVGCEAAGGLFALASLDTANDSTPQQVQALQQAWERVWVGKFGSVTPEEQTLAVRGAAWSRVIRVCGQPPGAEPMCGISVWFGRDARLYQAAIYAARLPADARDAFLEGLELP